MKITRTTSSSIAILLSMAVIASAGQAAQSTPARPGDGGSGADAAAPAAGRPPASVAPDYRLVPGDKLRIEVYKDAQLSQSLQVRPDGKITLPLIGDINAEGRTSTELRDAIVTPLKEYNTNPVVTVIVVETVPPVFYVMGEVNSPGTFPIKGQVSAVQALAMAGGFKDFAKTKSIRILRKGSGGSHQSIAFNYKDAVEGKGSPVSVQPGDTIIVP